MKTEPIVAARVDFESDGAAPRTPEFDDLYHPREGALEQARAVFLAGNGLPARWRGRARFTILETGFGLGHNFLATWAAWREDPARCERLDFISLEKHPLTRADLARAQAASPLAALAGALVEAWPPPTPNLHVLDFDGGRVRLLLGLGDASTLARQLVAAVDAFYLDGFAPARNAAMWSPPLFSSLARLAAPLATASTWSAARAVRDGLAGVGFEVHSAPGPGRKREITLARFAPRFTPQRPPGRTLAATAPTHAIVLGAGLAGALTASALARQGVPCLVIEREAAPATQASGNPAGLFHGTLGRADGPHARLHRAASLRAARWIREAVAAGVPGALDGLLRLCPGQPPQALRDLVSAQGLPDDYVQALDTAQASLRAGIELSHPAWFFPQAGWVDPAALVRFALGTPGVSHRLGCDIQRIERRGGEWQVFDGTGHGQGQAPLLVLANARSALTLAGLPDATLRSVRGQVSWVAAGDAVPPSPRLPIASGGYALALPDGRLLIGATQQEDDGDPQVREADHAANLAAAQALCGGVVVRVGARLQGRVGWRLVTHDRLPLAGLAPDLGAPLPARRDAPRLLPRQAGLLLHCALGSRGLTTAPLGADLLAAQAVGAPWPLEADLVDAIDPARLALR